MNFLNRTSIATLLGVSVAGLPAAATPITIDSTLSLETAFFDPNPTEQQTNVTIKSTESLGNFTHDFSLLGDTTFEVTWSAPAGQLIEIDVPNWNNYEAFLMGIGGGQNSNNDEFFAADSVSFQDQSGDPLDIEFAGVQLSTDGDEFTFVILFEEPAPGEVFRFSSATVTVTVPASFDNTFDEPFTASEITGDFRNNPPQQPDPGQWIRLIPEPGSLALLGLGGLLITRRR